MLDFNELFSRFGVFVGVRVVLFRETVVGFFDVGRGGGFVDTEDFVGVSLGLREVGRGGVKSLGRWLVRDVGGNLGDWRGV